MFTWLKTLFSPPAPVGAPRLLTTFNHQAEPLVRNAKPVAVGAWRLIDRPSGYSPLFTIDHPQIVDCLVTFRAELRSERIIHAACLELLCRLPGAPSLVARTPTQTLGGEDEWNYFEVTQHLEAHQRPSLLRLGLATEDPGTVSIRKVQVFVTPVE